MNQSDRKSQINSSSNSNNTSSSTNKGTITNVVNTAIAQSGKPYVYGASGPNSFDCSGLLYYSFKQNGYSMPRAIRNAGFSIGTNMANAQLGDIIVSPQHVSMVSEKKQMTMTHEGMVVYSFRFIEATNTQGVKQTNQYFPLMIRIDGKVIGTEGQILNDYQYWTDIRRVR
ncbi:MAG: C40 family peptidase [Thomasclavelia ramosa]|nr:C40 family peptidase [Thomasclavelia ramosa]